MKITVDLSGLTIDTGYGEKDCSVQAEVLIHTEPVTIYDTPKGAYMGERIKEIEITEKAIWIIDQWGGEKEYFSDCEDFDQLIKDAAREIYELRN